MSHATDTAPRVRPPVRCTLLALLGLLAPLGCGDDGEAGARGVDNPRGTGTGAAAGSQSPRGRELKQQRFVHPSAVEEDAPEPPRAASSPEAGSADGSTERNLPAEFRAAIGDPSPCMESSLQLPARVTVSAEAHVSATGLVTRAEVSAPGLPEGVLRCIQSRVEAVRFAGPVDGAPRPVHTTIILERGGS